MIDMNALQQLMAFADKSHAFDAYGTPSGSGFQPTIFNVPKMKLDWAMSMLGGQGGERQMPEHQMPDFFGAGNAGSAPPSYVQPQRFQGQMPPQQPPQSPVPVTNYLAGMMKR
jgi:hypothetical protein